MINIKQWEEICLSSLSNSYLGQKWAIWAGQAADWNRLLIFLYSLLNLHLILFNHAKLSSFIDGLQHFEDNFNAFSFENFRVRWHTIIYDFFALLNTQPKDFCLLTISRCCLKKRGRKVAPNQTSCQNLSGWALPSWCRVGARPNQKMDGGYIQCEFPRTLVPIQHSKMSVYQSYGRDIWLCLVW